MENFILEAIEQVYSEVKDGPEGSEYFTEIEILDSNSSVPKSSLKSYRSSKKEHRDSSIRYAKSVSCRNSVASSQMTKKDEGDSIWETVTRNSIATKQTDCSASKDRSRFKRVVNAVDTKKLIPKDALPISKLIEPTLDTAERRQ